MAVYTEVTLTSLRLFLNNYAIGKPLQLHGISDGADNTNYLVSTDQGEFILTLFETLKANELPYFLSLMAFYTKHQIPCAQPIPDNRGHLLGELNQRPCAIIERLAGHSTVQPSVMQCEQIGATLAKMHKASLEFELRRQNQHGLDWLKRFTKQLLPRMPTSDAQLLLSEQHYLVMHPLSDLPTGIIHGDLFRDNALFEEQILTGVLDLYDASDGVFIFDIAITVNDWCSSNNGNIDNNKSQSLLAAYNHFRPLELAERHAWPIALRRAALRFWLSRLLEKHFPRRDYHIAQRKNPETFKKILLSHIENNTKSLDLLV